MDIRKIRKLIAIMEESDINELEIQEGDECIRLRRTVKNDRSDAKRPEEPSSGETGV